MLRFFKLLPAIALLSISLISCKREQYNLRINDQGVSINILRLEKDLFEMNPAALPDSIGFLKSKYGSFLKYFGYVINIGEMSDSTWNGSLADFCTDRQNNEVYGSVKSVFADISGLEKGLNNAFNRYKYFFSDRPVPAVYTCITGFNNSLITVRDSILGISLDRYLGSENKYYQKLGLYRYQVARMNPENILSDCMYGWASACWDYSEATYEKEDVLSTIIHEGKLLYFARCMLPEAEETLLMGFSEKQLDFCKKNEGRMWQYLIENNLLFSTDQLTKKKLTGDAPFTAFFSNDSPGRAAAWIGFRIIESYMSRNRDITLAGLMKETDIQGILEKAKYHPPAK